MNQPIDQHLDRTLTHDVRQYINANTHFTGAGRADVLKAAVQYVQHNSESVCVIAGPKGIGKTNMLSQLRSRLENEACCISLEGYFDNLDTLLQLLMRKLGLVDRVSSSTQQCLDTINQAMEGFQDKRPLVLLFDDAHKMPLAIIRRLATLARDQSVRLRVILAMDQEMIPGFDQLVDNQRMLSLSMCRIPRQDIQSYLSHRYGPEVQFDELELSAIFQESTGIPKLINDGAAVLTSNRVVQSGVPALDLPTLAPLMSGEAAKNEYSEDGWFADSPFSARAAGARDHDAIAAYAVALAAAACLTTAVAVMTLSGSFDNKRANSSYVFESAPQATQPAPWTNERSRRDSFVSDERGIQDRQFRESYTPQLETSKLTMPAEFPAERIAANVSVQPDLSKVLTTPLNPKPGNANTTPALAKLDQKTSMSDEQVLLNLKPDYFVLQFVAGSSQDAVKQFIQQNDALPLRMFADRVKGRTVYKAVSSGFPNATAAQNAIDQLPAELRKDKPWVRPVGSVHKEIRRGRAHRTNAGPMPPGSQLAAVN